MQFRDRTDAGQHLAEALSSLGPRTPAVVLALPRGGVPVAAPVAAALGATLDVMVVRKLGAPSQPELAIGAIAEHGVRVLDPAMLERLRLDDDAVATVEAAERRELQRRVHRYRGGRPLPDLTGRTVVVVDDGLATGATAVAACRAVRTRGPDRLVLAVPVGSAAGVEHLREEADDVVCPIVPHRFRAVGQWYADFAQTSDDEVLRLLADQPAQNPDTGTSR
ncbi:phosphoribosyltransferase [Egicoccus sp. AB-alg6-2]|uniref:phosphoribosyltransferase n=1 Tax=Egicoccus sp. AB-alg6-2 TaxID=3242692 RepID=UPI00359E9449